MRDSEDGACGESFQDGALRCSHDFGHAGPHSWHNRVVHLFGGLTYEEVRERSNKGSPAALAILNAIEEKEEGT